MGLYSRYILPRIVHFTCDNQVIERQRAKIVPAAEGTVLEVGIGSGLNLPFYDPGKVSKLIGLDPSEEMTGMARAAARAVPFDVEFVGLPGEEIPLESNSVDTVLVTYTLCTIPDAERALRQMARVLKRDGTLLFCEHGAAPDESVRRWQDLATPVWSRFGGGCRLNLDIPGTIERGGFQVKRLDTMYIPGWRPVSFNYWGAAQVA